MEVVVAAWMLWASLNQQATPPPEQHRRTQHRRRQRQSEKKRNAKPTRESQPRRPDEVCGASWYGERFRGRATASGEPFNPDAMTAAHRTLPLGSRIEVSYGSETIRVKVNDRGPYAEGRCLDLSRGSFERLAPTSRGVIRVAIRD